MPASIEPGVRLPQPLYGVLRRMSEKNRRSLNAEIVFALEQYVQSFLAYEQRRDQLFGHLSWSRPWISGAADFGSDPSRDGGGTEAEDFVAAEHRRLEAALKAIEAGPGGTTDGARLPQLSRLAVTATLLMEDLTNTNLPVMLSNIMSGSTKPPADRQIVQAAWINQARSMLGRWVDEHGITE